MGSRVLRETFAFNNKLMVTAMAVFALLVQPAYALVMSQTARAADMQKVTPANMNGWVKYGTAPSRFVSTPSPLGLGALELSANTSSEYSMHWNDSTNTAALATDLNVHYSSKRLAGPAHAAPSYVLLIEPDGDSTTSVEAFYAIYEPAYNDTGAEDYNAWNTWNITSASKFWYTAAYGPRPVGAVNYTPLSDVLASMPNATVIATVINFGTGNDGWSALIDNVKTADDVVYDFDPISIVPCETTSTYHSTTLEGWNLSETRATGHNEIVETGLRIWTEGNTSTDKAAGYLPVDVALQYLGANTNNILSITTNSGTTQPGGQLVIDFDNDGTVDGILVGEPTAPGYGNNWWLSNSSAQFIKDSAPHNGGGMGSEWYGEANEWLNAFPGARVKAIGYSLGSGVKGDYIITKISVGCVDYTFGLPEEETEEPELPVGGLGGESVQTTTTTTTVEETVVVTTMMPATTEVAEVADTAVDSTSEEAEIAGDQDDEKTWSLVNVLLAVATTILSVVAVLGLRKNDEDSKLIRLLTIVPAVAAIGVVLWVEDFSAKLGWFNAWTFLLAVIVAAQAVLFVNSNAADEE